jgi:hypothetical protein
MLANQLVLDDRDKTSSWLVNLGWMLLHLEHFGLRPYNNARSIMNPIVGPLSSCTSSTTPTTNATNVLQHLSI